MSNLLDYYGPKDFREPARLYDESFPSICDPMLVALYDKWVSYKTEHNCLPSKSEFSPHSIKPYLSHVFLVDREEATGEFRYRLMGTEEARLRGSDRTGELVKNAAVGSVDNALNNYQYVFEEGLTLFIQSEVHRSKSLIVRDQTLFLPLAHDGVNVDLAFCIGARVQTRSPGDTKVA